MTRQKKRQSRRARRPNLTRETLEAIPLWVELGARPPDVAGALGMTVESLSVICSRHNISLRPSRAALVTALTPEQWRALQREAVRRGVPVWQLIARTLAAVVDHGLFSAVLGDYDLSLTTEKVTA